MGGTVPWQLPIVSFYHILVSNWPQYFYKFLKKVVNQVLLKNSRVN